MKNKQKTIKVVVQGLGFVGSAMATAIAMKSNKSLRYDVTGIDLPTKAGNERIDSVNSGIFPFKTNDTKLTTELKKAVSSGNLKANSDHSFYEQADIVLVSVNCDLINENGKQKIAIENFEDCISHIANKVKENVLVIIETTVPPGTCKFIVYPIFEKAFKKRSLDISKFYLAHSYERVMPGNRYLDSIINYWRVYSGINEESAEMCKVFLQNIINTKKYPLKKLSNTTASETSKLLENSYRAVNIAFMEEWGRFSEDVGIDIYEIIDAIRDRPTHSNIRQPGFGVGGYCLTKDPLFAKIAARDIFNLDSHEFPFSSQSIEINSKMPKVTLSKICDHFDGHIQGKSFLLMGATYRQDVGDTRFSPSENFAKDLMSMKVNITVCDPLIEYWEEMQMEIHNKILDFSNYHAIIFAVPHKEFTKIDFSSININKKALIFDSNNVLSKHQITHILRKNLKYASIGRG